MARHYEETLDSLNQADLKLLEDIDWSKLSIHSTKRTNLNGQQQKAARERNLVQDDYAYHPELELYLKLTKLIPGGANASPSEWECQIDDPMGEAGGKNKKKEDAKIKVDPKVFAFYITLNLAIMSPQEPNRENQITEAAFKVHIIEPLVASLLNPLEKLMASNFILVENGKELDTSKSPRELGLKHNAQLMVYGSLSNKIENITSSTQLRFFKRFRDVRGDGWYIGKDRWDAVTYIPKRDVRVFGVGIFEPYPQARKDFKYGYKYVLKDADDSEVETS
jgi:hypothetical protein